jgi:hypothetical protein
MLAHAGQGLRVLADLVIERERASFAIRVEGSMDRG